MVLSVHDKVDAFYVELDAEAFAPGDEVTGRVHLRLKRTLAIQCMDLMVQGSCNVLWRPANDRAAETVAGDKVYLNEFVELVNKSDNELMSLSEGEHIFPFISRLPPVLPSSFAAAHGRVAYIVKVTLRGDKNESGHLEPSMATKSFMVYSKLQLEDFMDRLRVQKFEKKFPVKSGNVRVSLVLARTAYDANDMIAMSVDVKNFSSKTVRNLKAILIMEVVYCSQGRTVERIKVAETRDEQEVQRYSTRRWRQIGLKVPENVPPSGLPNCELVTLQYWLVFGAELAGSDQRLFLHVPVVVGIDIPPELKGFEDSVDASDGEVQQRIGDGESRVDVRYERPNAKPPLQATDTQVVRMQLYDEAEDSRAGGSQRGVFNDESRNPLMNGDSAEVLRFGQSRERLFQNLEAGMDDGEEVLY